MRDIHLTRSFVAAMIFTGALWLIHTAQVLTGTPLGSLGIRPGQTAGLHGIVTAPLVHGSFTHLLANTPPLLVLGSAMLYGFPRAAKIAVPMIWLASGLGVWLFAREAVHVGASGLAYGTMFFIFVIGVLRRDRPSMALAMIVFFLYGGMVWGILPAQPGVSFEFHLFGALAGVVAAFLLRRRDPLIEDPRYDWEKDPAAEDEDPFNHDRGRDTAGPGAPTRRWDKDK